MRLRVATGEGSGPAVKLAGLQQLPSVFGAIALEGRRRVRRLDCRRAAAAFSSSRSGRFHEEGCRAGDEKARSDAATHQPVRRRASAEPVPEGLLRQPRQVGFEGGRIPGAVRGGLHPRIHHPDDAPFGSPSKPEQQAHEVTEFDTCGPKGACRNLSAV